MAEGVSGPSPTNWLQQFQFTHLFRAFRLAVHPTKLALAFCAVVSIYLGGRVLDAVSLSSSQPVAVIEKPSGRVLQSELDVYLTTDAGDWSDAADKWAEGLKEKDHTGVFKLLLAQTESIVAGMSASILSGNLQNVAQWPAVILRTKIWLIEMHPLYALLFTVLCLFSVALFGGALCRVASVHVAREEQIGFGEALAFARSKLKSFIVAPLLPYIIIGVAGLVLFLGGLVGAIPWLGELAVGLLFVLALLVGLGIAFVFIGAVGGLWLMFPTVATEGSDAGDALARSFSYVYNKPWKTVFYYLVSMFYGAICFWFVKYLVRIMLIFVHLFVGWSMNWGNAYVSKADGDSERTAADKLSAVWQAPDAAGATPFWGTFDSAHLMTAKNEPAEPASATWLGQFLIKVWIYLVVAAVAAFAVSFAYCACTLIYFLLRREVDATDMEDVYLEDHQNEAATTAPPPADSGAGGTSLPVVGQ